MNQNICQCHCGTRIDLDQQLLEERELWREKYSCLQSQVQTDMTALKQNIYAQCANILQKELSSKQVEHNNIINAKNQEIRDLVSRIIRVESQNKVLSKEKQILNSTVKELEREIQDKDRAIDTLRSRHLKDINEFENKNSDQLNSLKKRLQQHFSQQIGKVEKQNQHLKHKVKQFEKKYQTILPQIQKIKNALNNKTAKCEQLQSLNEKQSKQNQRKINSLSQQNEELLNKVKSFEQNNRKLKEQIDQLSKQLQQSKKVKRQIKVQAVYVDRPIEVQKVVQKIVEREKIVKQYIQPSNSNRMKELEEDNKKLTEQLSNVLKQLHHIQDGYEKSATQYEECIRAHESNTIKYKKERQALARRIQDQNKELQMLQAFIEKRRALQIANTNQDAQRIVVHVKGDGSYSKTVDRVPASQLKDQTKTKPSNLGRKI